MQKKYSFTFNCSLAKSQKGITLMALVITIVILLILSGITINVALGERGIIKTTEEFANKEQEYQEQKNQEIENEQKELQNVMDDIYAQDAVAKIESKYYTTLQEAINAVPTANVQTTIMLLKDIKENVIIKENQDIILDCQGKKIENKEDNSVINTSGKLIIQNSNLRK